MPNHIIATKFSWDSPSGKYGKYHIYTKGDDSSVRLNIKDYLWRTLRMGIDEVGGEFKKVAISKKLYAKNNTEPTFTEGDKYENVLCEMNVR